jgi:hypothetical protein
VIHEGAIGEHRAGPADGAHRGVAKWFTAGAFTLEVGGLMAGAVLVSAIALTIWFFAARPNISDIFIVF